MFPFKIKIALLIEFGLFPKVVLEIESIGLLNR